MDIDDFHAEPAHGEPLSSDEWAEIASDFLQNVVNKCPTILDALNITFCLMHQMCGVALNVAPGNQLEMGRQYLLEALGRLIQEVQVMNRVKIGEGLDG